MDTIDTIDTTETIEAAETAYHHYKTRADAVYRRYSAETAMACLLESGEVARLSYAGLRRAITDAEDALTSCKIVPGDRAAILTPHSPSGVIAGMALAHMGVTSVLLDASLPIEEAARLLAFSDVRALFTTEGLFKGLPPSLTGDIPCFRLGAGWDVHRLLPGSADEVLRGGTPDKERDVVAVIFSSGTTDQVKGVRITYRSVLRARDIFADLSGLKSRMAYLLVLPFNHIAGFTGAMTYLLTGCELDFLERPDPSRLLEGLKTFRPHYFAMVPRVYEIMEERIRARIRAGGAAARLLASAVMAASGCMRRHLGINVGRYLCRGITSQVFGDRIYGIGTGASPCRESTTRFFLDLGLEWADLYATTETGVPITATGVHDRYPVGTVGRVDRYEGVRVRIRQPDGEGIGEILVRTDMIMKGYFRRPDLTAAAFDGEGYFKTGDYGYIDKGGYLHITGRVKEAILLPTGKKVSPADIDAFYADLCGEVRIASCGVKGADGYDAVHLSIESQGHSRSEVEGVRRRILERSSTAGPIYQVAAVHVIGQLPLTSVGKVKRFLLKEMAEKELAAKMTAEKEAAKKTAGRAIADKTMAGRAMPGGAMADRPMPGRAMTGRPMAGRAMTGRAMAGRAMAGRLMAGRALAALASGEGIPTREPFGDGADDILCTICSLIVEVSGWEGTVTPDLKLGADIGMGSLEVFELCTVLEERYGVPIGSSLHGQITVGEVEMLIRKGAVPDNAPSAAIGKSAYPVKKDDRMVRSLLRWTRLLSFPYKFHIEGTENIPKEQNLIICANHASYLDSFWLLDPIKDRIDLKKLAGLAAAERLEGYWSKRLCALLGEIPVDRTGNTVPALQRARECIEKDGYTMIIFPEGARSRDGSMLPFKHGAAKLAVESKTMILPVYIGGSFAIFPRHRKRPRLFDWEHLRRYSLQIRYGSPVDPDGKTVERVTEEVEQQILSLGADSL